MKSLKPKPKGLQLTQLPTVILSEILQNLPFKDILQSRATCKTLRCATMDHHFIYTQIARNKQAPTFLFKIARSQALYVTFPNNSSSSLSKLVHLPSISNILASCNGLLIGTTQPDEEGLFVLNPITNERLELPSFLDPLEEYPLDYNLQVLFGFDQINKKYKVVVIYSSNWQANTVGFRFKCKILTVGGRSCSWRKLVFPYMINIKHKPVFLNGTFHWLIVTRELYYSNNILAFNITTEAFQTMGFRSCPGRLFEEGYQATTVCSMHAELSRFSENIVKLVDIRGSLAIVSITKGVLWRYMGNDNNSHLIHIWQMMENQNGERYLYEYSVGGAFEKFLLGIEVSEILSDGRLLIEGVEWVNKFPYLTLYDPKRGVRNTVDVCGISNTVDVWEISRLPSAISFVPSLLSPSAL